MRGDEGRRSWRSFPAHTHASPRQDGLTMNSLQDPLPARGFKNSDFSSQRLLGPAMSTSGLDRRCSPIHVIQFSLQSTRGSTQACPALQRASQGRRSAGTHPRLLSKRLERVHPAGQCAEGRGAHGKGSGCTDSKPPWEKQPSLLSGIRLRCKDKRFQ